MNGNVPSLAPVGIPKGVDPRTWRQAIEKRLNELLDQSLALITALDTMEVDCDLEETGDAEPWLGWSANGPRADPTGGDGRELDESDDEPWLASPERHPSPWGWGHTPDGKQISWCNGTSDDGEVGEGDDEDGHDAELDQAEGDFPGFIEGGLSVL